ncbi:hypothetical protein [Cupriavidus necator]
MAEVQSIVGNTYGYLTVVARAERKSGKRPRIYWSCVCKCGKTTVVEASNLKAGAVKSCGCIHKERVVAAVGKHGAIGTPEYVAWGHMKSRCYNTANPDYPNWGGRGIRVCDRWRESFVEFLADMGPRPDGMTIERMDNDGDYEPGNCRWATRREQARNTRRSRYLTVSGVTRTVAEWCEKTGMSERMVRRRLDRGWSAMRALGITDEPSKPEALHAA